MKFTFIHDRIDCAALEKVCSRLGLTSVGELKIDLLEEEGYFCAYDGAVLTVRAPLHYVFRALVQLKKHALAPFSLKEERVFVDHGVMLDCSRNAVPSLECVKQFLVCSAMMGFNTLQLYTEDTYEIEGEPYFGHQRGRYSKSDLKELDAFARSFGITLIPCIQTLAHLSGIFRWQRFRKINDVNDILLVGEDKTYELIEKMFDTIAECFTARTVNIGMDEAFLLGRGMYAERNGIDIDRMKLFVSHLERVAGIAAKHGFHCAMWSDMFYRIAFGGYYSENNPLMDGGIADELPENISLIYWDYYEQRKEHFDAIIRQHAVLRREVWFAGGAWTWLGFLPDNEFSIRAARASVASCRENGVKRSFLAMWGDDGAECPYCAVLPSLVCASEAAYGHDDKQTAEETFELLFGVPMEVFLIPERADQIGNYLNVSFSDPTKYLLYSDCFAGFFDGSIEEADSAKFAGIAEKLKPYEKGEWAYYFTYARCLCEAMELKYSIGLKTRRLYQSGDVKGLKLLANRDYRRLVTRLKAFYAAFSGAWHREKKQNGFEVHDARLGGLILRVEHCRRMILDYCDGKLTRLTQLEERLVDGFGEEEVPRKQTGYINSYARTVSVNFI